MGRDKALIPIDGVPMLRLVWQVASQCASCVYVVTPWVSRYRSIIPEASWVAETPYFDASAELEPQGPLIGFCQGLHHVSTEWVLVLACDLPNVQASQLHQWIDHLDKIPNEAIACLPRHAKGWEPLCGFYRRSCLPTLNLFIQSGGRSFQRWLSSQTIEVLDVSDPQMLINCNTPDDLSRVISSKGCD